MTAQRPVVSGEVFDHTLWGDFDEPGPAPRAAVVPYSPAPAPAVPPGMAVVIDADGRPRYVPSSFVAPQPLAQPDVVAQRMRAVLPAGLGVLAVGGGAWLVLAGLAMATRALVSLAIVAVGGTVVLLLAKSAGGIHVSNVRLGDGANFQAGTQR